MTEKQIFNQAYRLARAAGIDRKRAEQCAQAVVFRARACLESLLPTLIREEIDKTK